jgi:site-specific recombinase XerD
MRLLQVVDGRTSKPRLLDQVRDAIRVRHLSIRTEQAYLDWIRRFIIFHQKRHPRDLGKAEITRFLTWLATHRRVAASTQNQALCALLFLYRHVLEQDFPWLDDLVWAKTRAHIPPGGHDDGFRVLPPDDRAAVDATAPERR